MTFDTLWCLLARCQDALKPIRLVTKTDRLREEEEGLRKNKQRYD